jgi:hypothetical protein
MMKNKKREITPEFKGHLDTVRIQIIFKHLLPEGIMYLSGSYFVHKLAMQRAPHCQFCNVQGPKIDQR